MSCQGHNTFVDNEEGIYVNHSNPNFGDDEEGYGNNIMAPNDEESIWASNYSYVLATTDWWDTYDEDDVEDYMIYESSNSSIYYSPILYSPPSTNANASVASETSQTNSANSLSKQTSIANSVKSRIRKVKKLIKDKSYTTAIEECKTIIEKYSTSSLAYYALSLLKSTSELNKDKTSFSSFVEAKSKLKNKTPLYGYAELLLAMDEKENRVELLDKLAQKYKDTDLVETILYDKFMYYLNEQTDVKFAETTSDELGKLFPKSRLYYSSQRELGKDVKRIKRSELVKENNVEKEESILPKEYALLGNYPNPFNPTTTIKYALPFSSNVELTIYDLTGKEIKSFIVNSQSSGFASVVWDGTNNNGTQVTSGVYIYKFRAVSLGSGGEVFEKSSKLMLLK